MHSASWVIGWVLQENLLRSLWRKGFERFFGRKLMGKVVAFQVTSDGVSLPGEHILEVFGLSHEHFLVDAELG